MGKEIQSDEETSVSTETKMQKMLKFQEKQKQKKAEKRKKNKQKKKEKKFQGDVMTPANGNDVKKLLEEAENNMQKSSEDTSVLEQIQTKEVTPPPKQEKAAGVNKVAMDIEIDYVEKEDDFLTGRHIAEFKHIFEHFLMPRRIELGGKAEDEDSKAQAETDAASAKADGQRDLNDPLDSKPLSKKKRKLMTRMKVADLKQLVKRPELVEGWDVTATDPIFLMALKSYRNSVPVPKHWSQKRRYLQYKRGVQKVPFKLPDFIEATGISKIREASHDAHKSLRQKMRERMQPKMGKIDIDYQVLHDAFFKYQTKPKLSIHGDIYFEGKEYELKMRIYKPGRLSPELRQSLGIPDNSPPPWIINMQRYGPPPSYPNLKIPGVNCPVPENIQLGWGKLFTDERGSTVYADCYGLTRNIYNKKNITRKHWGELREEEEVEEEEEEEEQNEESDVSGDEETAMEDEEESNGISSILTGQETHEMDPRRKAAIAAQARIPDINVPSGSQTDQKQLYHVLKEVPAGLGGSSIYGSAHGYIVPGLDKAKELNEEELEAIAKETKIEEKVEPEKKEEKGDRKKKKKKKDSNKKQFKF